MSTSYYGLKYPFTDLSADENTGTITVWQEDEICGHISTNLVNYAHIIQIFFDMEVPILHTHWGGNDVGMMVEEDLSDWYRVSGASVLLSEYGDLVDMKDVQAISGRGKK